MDFNPYKDYFKYVMEHKKNVFIECIDISKQYKGQDKLELIIHAFTHDLSKFLPCEFIPYTKYFYIDKGKYEEVFNKAWEHHYKYNKHHWNYWIGKDMPIKYIRQMICDWKAMSRKFGDTAQEFYLKNYTKFKLSHDTRLTLESNLSLCYNGFCECDEYYWRTIEEIIKDCLEYEKNNPNHFDKHWFYDEFLQSYKDKYNVNMLKILKLNN